MNNKKIALVVFIFLIALVAASVGALFSLGKHIQANLLNQGIANGADVASSLVAETDFEKCGKFNDVTAATPYCWLTKIMRDRNIFTGDANGNFRANDPITRAEFAKILVTALYGNSVILQSASQLDGSTLGFTDLSGNHWAHPYIKIAKEKGLIGGYPDGTFRMGSNVTRAEFAKMLYSRIPDFQTKLDEAKAYLFNGVQTYETFGLTPGQWYSDYVLLLIFSDSHGTFLQDCGGKICPEKLITRLEIAAAIQRLNNIYNMTIGFAEGDITADVNQNNCTKIRNLADMTQTLKNLGIPTTVLSQCSRTYPSVWMQTTTTSPSTNLNPSASDITDDLSAENCLKISRLSNMTATLTSLGIPSKLMSSCARGYAQIWNKCSTLLNWKSLYGNSGLSSRMSSAQPPFTSEDSIQCRDKYGSTWFNTPSI